MKTTARKILMDNGWFNDFYYVLKVMEGNRSSTKVVHETTTRKWGTDVLKRKLDYLRDKNPSYALEFNDIWCTYYDTIHNKHEEIIDAIIANIKEPSKETKE